MDTIRNLADHLIGANSGAAKANQPQSDDGSPPPPLVSILHCQPHNATPQPRPCVPLSDVTDIFDFPDLPGMHGMPGMPDTDLPDCLFLIFSARRKSGMGRHQAVVNGQRTFPFQCVTCGVECYRS
jgi:hypothetical protein